MAGSDPSIVKTTWPELLTVPVAKDEPSFVTVYGMVAAFPPIVHVIVWDDSLEVWVQAYEEPRDHSLNPAMVTEAVVSLFVTVRSVTLTDPSAIVPLTVRLLNAMRWFVIVNTFELVTVRVSALRSVARATVPAMVSVANRWLAPRVIEPVTLVKVTAEPIDVRVVAEEVSHDPAMESVDAPRFRTAGPLEFRLPLKTDVELVSVSAPDQVMLETKVVLMPGLTTMSYKVCVTLTEPPERLTTTVDVPAANTPAAVLSERTVRMLALAVSAPPTPTVRAFAIIGRLAPEVVNEVVPEPPWIAMVWATRPSEAIVNVVVSERLSTSTVLNSLPARLAPANVMIWSIVPLNVTTADPADQDAEVTFNGTMDQ